MTDAIICNHCQYQQLITQAKERGVFLRLRAERPVIAARFDDKAYDSAWFSELTDSCTCP